MKDPVVIVGAARTPMGGMQGVFTDVHTAILGGTAIQGALRNAGINGEAVDEVIMGCVLSAGLGQAPARQAGLNAGLSEAVPATTLNKMCGSGMKAAMLAHDGVALGHSKVSICGGMENMTNAPYLLPKMRGGQRLGHGQVIDHMFFDGLEDAYEKGRLMGAFAEDCADRYDFTREQQDAFALESLARARAASEKGLFASEIVPVSVKTRSGTIEVVADEQLASARPEKIPHLKPAFREGGTVTAANASSISDGAAALVLMRESEAIRQGLRIRARVLGHASHAQAPQWFSTAPIPAITQLLEQLGMSVADVDLWEINEAFAVVPMSAMADLGINHSRLNIHGGACALGHPIGASGARIIVSLLNALDISNKRFGAAALCIGGGEATAMVIERIEPTPA